MYIRDKNVQRSEMSMRMIVQKNDCPREWLILSKRKSDSDRNRGSKQPVFASA